MLQCWNTLWCCNSELALKAMVCMLVVWDWPWLEDLYHWNQQWLSFFLRLVTHLPAPLIPGYKNLKMIIIKSSDVLWCRPKYFYHQSFSWRFCFWPWILSLWCFSHSFTSWASLHGPVLALVAADKWGVADTTKKSWPQLLNTLQGPRPRTIVLVWTSQRILSGTKADRLLSG